MECPHEQICRPSLTIHTLTSMRAAAAAVKIQPFLQKWTPLRKPISQFPSALDPQLSVADQVLRILSTTVSIEPPLEHLVPVFSPNLVTTVLANPPPLRSAFHFFNWASKRARFRSRASYGLMVSLLRGASPGESGFDSAWACLEEIKTAGGTVTPHSFEALLCAYIDSGMTPKAIEAFGRMEEFGCSPSVFVYNALLSVLVREGVFLLAVAVYNQLLKSNCSPNRTTFNILISGHCKAGKTQDAMALFAEMSLRGLVPDTMVYNIIIHNLCRARRLSDATALLDSMRRAKVAPCVVTYCTILNGFCKLGRMEEAFELLGEFKEEGFVLGLDGYSSLIDGLFKSKQFEEACQWYAAFLGKNIQPDCILYTTMIRGCVEEGKIDEAFLFFRQMTDRDVKPDTFCYNTLIKGLCDVGRLDKARSLQLEISRFSNSATYTILICGLCSQGLVVEAEQIFDEMGKQGCFPTVRTFNALINGLCKAERVLEAQIMFCRMEMGRTPSVFLRLSQNTDLVSDSQRLQELVEQLCQSGHVAKAYNLLHSLADTSIVQPNIFTYGILIHRYCKNGDFDRVFNLVKDLQIRGLSPDTLTYGIIINGCLRKNQFEQALTIFDIMLKSGCTPSLMIYHTVMKVLCRMKNIPRAINLWLNYLLERCDISVEDAATIAAAKEALGQGSVEEMVRCLIKMDLKNGSCCPKPFCIWIIGYCHDGNPDLALKIFNVLKECGIDAIPASYASLIHVFCKQSKTIPATEVMLYALRKGYQLAARYGNFLIQRLWQEGNEKTAKELMSRIDQAGYGLEIYLDGRTKALLYRQKPYLLSC